MLFVVKNVNSQTPLQLPYRLRRRVLSTFSVPISVTQSSSAFSREATIFHYSEQLSSISRDDASTTVRQAQIRIETLLKLGS